MAETFGRYELVERLGFGGMAEVFLARTAGVGGFEKLLAIKRLLPHCTEDSQTVDLLADEARITVQLTHPNIVQVFDFGQTDGSYFIAMEYVDGVDLKTLVQIDEERSRPLPLDVALHVTISVLEGLDFAHKRVGADGVALGIIHRDVSPHNVLISRHGQIKLTDFGVARARISSHVSVVGDIRGKFSYMPPEQACGGEIDHRVDIFAAGAILYELLSGIQPFRSTSTGEQMKLLSSKVAPPSTVAPNLPTALDAITLRSLATNPDDRYDSAAEFAHELKQQVKALGADRLVAQQKVAELIEELFREAEEEGRKIDDSAQLHSLNEMDGGYEDSLIFADQLPQESVHGELSGGRDPGLDEVELYGQPSVAFSDALLQEVAIAERASVVDHRSEDRTEVVLRRREPGPRSLSLPAAPEQSEDNPLAFASTDVQKISGLAHPPAGMPIASTDSESYRTKIHHAPALGPHSEFLDDETGSGRDDPTEIGHREPGLGRTGGLGRALPSGEIKTSIHLTRDDFARADINRPTDEVEFRIRETIEDGRIADRAAVFDGKHPTDDGIGELDELLGADGLERLDDVLGHVERHDRREAGRRPGDPPPPGREPGPGLSPSESGRPSRRRGPTREAGGAQGRYAIGRDSEIELAQGENTEHHSHTGPPDADFRAPTRPQPRSKGRPERRAAHPPRPSDAEPAEREYDAADQALYPSTEAAPQTSERPWLAWVGIGVVLVLAIAIAVTIATC